MRRPRLGDVYELRDGDKFAYMQYIHKDPVLGYCVRVFPKFHEEPRREFESFRHGEASFRLFCPLYGFVKDGVLCFVQNQGILDEDKLPIRMLQREKNGKWTLIEDGRQKLVESLTSDQRQWPLFFGIYSYDPILAKIRRSNGIDEGMFTKELMAKEHSAFQPQSDETKFFLYFKLKTCALSAAKDAEKLHVRSSVEKRGDVWALLLTDTSGRNVSELLEEINVLAMRNDGEFDGFESFVPQTQA